MEGRKGTKRDVIRELIEKANAIGVQMVVVRQLQKGPLFDFELRELIENLDGDYELILPILKKSGLVRLERLGEGHRGNRFKYYATMLEKADNNNGHNGNEHPVYTYRVKVNYRKGD